LQVILLKTAQLRTPAISATPHRPANILTAAARKALALLAPLGTLPREELAFNALDLAIS